MSPATAPAAPTRAAILRGLFRLAAILMLPIGAFILVAQSNFVCQSVLIPLLGASLTILGLVALPFSRDVRRAWPEMLGLFLSLLLVTAVIGIVPAQKLIREPPKAAAAQTTQVALPYDKIEPTVMLPGSVALLLRTKEQEPNGGVTWKTTRYEAQLDDQLSKGSATSSGRDVMITLKRGEKDANIAAFLRDLAVTDRVFILPPN